MNPDDFSEHARDFRAKVRARLAEAERMLEELVQQRLTEIRGDLLEVAVAVRGKVVEDAEPRRF